LDGASSPIPLFLREASPKCVSSVTKVSCYVPLANATLHPQRTMSWMGHSSQFSHRLGSPGQEWMSFHRKKEVKVTEADRIIFERADPWKKKRFFVR